MRQISADREIPVQADCPQCRPGDETATNAKKAAQNADHESDYDQINRADVGAGDRKEHGLFRAAANQPQQKRGHILEKNRLADHEQNGDAGVSVAMILFELLQSFSQKVQHQKEIRDHEHSVDHELNYEGAKRLGRFLFHLFPMVRFMTCSRSCAIMVKSKFRCSAAE